jgi:hypothetical protein
MSGGTPGHPVGLGLGLRSIKRLASVFDLHTARSAGTVVLGRFYFAGTPQPGAVRGGGVSVAVVPSDVNGDGWALATDDSSCSVLVVDGLGHGPAAHEAARAAMTTFPGAVHDSDLCRWVERAHDAMRPTRGGVVGFAQIDVGSRTLQFAGIGNVSGRVIAEGESHGLVSRPGTVGAGYRTPPPRLVTASWPPGAALILWSDGIKTPPEWDRYRTLWSRDPAVVAAVLYRDCRRAHDDATVVVVQDRSEGRP